ncbi:HEPN domain-containing protein [Paenibacillus durus]|uniref:DNA polymerase III subunit tau-like C-terminal domain-containing protein n=1 Tax=Paenibacillus durus TaxID=44251 RepID=A0A089INV2_PAEDU|nr:HEPN domain-containing protein [Paenibacillus durus]AIQ10759.1 hypothetical protein PDUR_00980 [Paenibacillus durus]
MLDINEIVMKWPQVLGVVKAKKITVHAWLMDGSPFKFENHILYLLFKSTIHMETTKKPNNVRVIEDVLKEVFSENIKIECLSNEDSLKETFARSQTIFSTELLFVLENGTRLSRFDTLVNLLNVDDEFIIQIHEQNIDKFKGEVLKNGKSIRLDIQINRYITNEEHDLVYKIILYGSNVEEVEDYTNHMIDLVHNRKEVKNKYLLWDGISQYYCTQAYNYINQVENRMRSFIMEFLCRKIGQHAFQKTLSNEIKGSIDNNNQKTPYVGFNTSLFNVEFRELGDFLFKEFDEFKDKEELIREIRGCNNIADLNKLKAKLPNSNWNKYFKDTVNNANLHTKWNNLIKYRNIVAHNKILTRKEYEQLRMLADEILSDIENAIESLDDMKLNIDEQEKISSNLDQIQLTLDCDKCGRTISFDEANFSYEDNELLFKCVECIQ